MVCHFGEWRYLAVAAVLQAVSLVLTHSPSYQGEDRPSGFHDPKIVHNAEHINEHLDGVADANQMSQEELEFQYFKQHDFDNNTKLDGLEMYKALTHLLPFEELEKEARKKIDPTGKTPEQIQKELKEVELKYYSDIVDNVLEEDDLDNDGYLTYTEYVLAHKKEAARDAAEARRQGKQ